MKKRFLPFLMAVLVLGQFAIADNGGHYVPRNQGNETANQFLGSLRANQHTGLIDPALMLQAAQNQEKATAADNLYWISMGPDNMGGQTTAVVYDTVKNVVYIGSKGGGVYKTYNQGVTWHQVGKQDLMVSCMVLDADGTIYVGTGDGAAAATYNGLDQQGYDNSFIGTGIWTLNGDDLDQMASTTPSLNDVSAWSFVNDLAISGNTLFAATGEGLKYTTDKGQTWHNAKYIDENGDALPLEGNAIEVKALSDGTIMASVDGALYIGKVNELVCHSVAGNNPTLDDFDNIIAIPTAAGLLDITFAPQNENIMFASCINASGVHTGIYVSYNKGNTWEVALPAVTANIGNNVYGGFGLYNHGIVVDPEDEGRLFILGYYLWKLEKPITGTGYYLCEEVTGLSMYMLPDYLHVGLHVLAFNPKHNSDECYFGTDGGVYKSTASNGNFTFSYSNRNYVTTRMFNVAMSGKDTRVIASALDHGAVLIEGDENLNSINHGDWVNPGAILGIFVDSYQGGPCAISTINPKTIFVSYKAGDFYRSETAGEDWVSTNFLENLTISTSSFRMPIYLYEDFDDELNPATVWYKNTSGSDIPSGTTMQIMSNNNYPFDYKFTHVLHNLDSIEIHDPISARLYVTFTGGVYMTRGALEFAAAPTWYQLTNSAAGFSGEPLCMTVSADGDHLFVGTKEGKLFRLSNLNTVIDDASGSLSDTTGAFQVTTTELTLPTEGQCVTSVAIDPTDANKIIVTLGNYGNDTYVLYSSNALANEPTVVSKQGNVPKMPIYSSVIAYDYSVDEHNSGAAEGPYFLLGTEHGIYTSQNLNSWTADSHMLGEVPVMDLKQQVFEWDDQIVETYDENEGVITTVYPGIHNKGVIYAATYGRGVFRCENFKQYYTSVPENSTTIATQVSMYPNPTQGQAMVSFEVKGDVTVSYQMYDLQGRMVKSQTLGRYTEGNYEISINLEDLSAGAYIMRLNQGNSSSCTKFLVY